MQSKPIQRQTPYSSLLGMRHRLGRGSVSDSRSRLHFDEHHRIALARNDVQLTGSMPPIALYHLEPDALEIAHRDVLPTRTELLMGRHIDIPPLSGRARRPIRSDRR